MNNSTRMLRVFRLSENLLLRRVPVVKCKRTFLSEAYRCQEEWDKRLESPLIKKVNPFDFYLELDNKLATAGKIAAVDVDIFANSLQKEGHIEDLLDVIYKHRLTPETTFTLPSTHYAVIRYLMDTESPKQIFDILNDRLNYGIFPDHHCFNILMDTYLKKKDFASAAKISTLLMLQEDSEHPISNALAVYSCHKYLEEPESWKAPEPEQDESVEEIKVRVKYLRNPYFDDHFDLVEPFHLVGKTLAFFGKHRGGTLGRTCQLRGLILYQKYPKVIKLLDEWKDKKEVVFQEVFSLIKKDFPALFDGELSEELSNLKDRLEDLEKGDLKAGNIVEEIEKNVKTAVAEKAESDIADQCKTFAEWQDKRMEVLQIHLAELNKMERIQNIKEIKKDLEDRERLVTFFDREEEIELAIEKKLEKEKRFAIDPKLLKKKLKFEESYVPPEVVKRKDIKS